MDNTNIESPNIYSYRSYDIGKIAEALSNAQGCMTAVKKNKHVKFTTKKGRTIKYSYADLAGVIELIRVPFKENVLSYTFVTSGNILKCILMHKSGQWFSSDYILYAESDGTMNHNQCLASAITYGRRYLLSALAGISDCDDDDGESSVSVEYKPQNNNPPKPIVTEVETIVTEAETLRREMNKIYNTFKENLESTDIMEQKVAYTWKPEVTNMFNYADSKPKLKDMLKVLLETHQIVLTSNCINEVVDGHQ